MIQLELAATVPLFNVTDVTPGARGTPPGPVRVAAAPPQPASEGAIGFASTTFVGRKSVKVVWVRSVLRSLFRMVRASWLACPTQTVFGVKLLVKDGAWTAP